MPSLTNSNTGSISDADLQSNVKLTAAGERAARIGEVCAALPMSLPQSDGLKNGD